MIDVVQLCRLCMFDHEWSSPVLNRIDDHSVPFPSTDHIDFHRLRSLEKRGWMRLVEVPQHALRFPVAVSPSPLRNASPDKPFHKIYSVITRERYQFERRELPIGARSLLVQSYLNHSSPSSSSPNNNQDPQHKGEEEEQDGRILLRGLNKFDSIEPTMYGCAVLDCFSASRHTRGPATTTTTTPKLSAAFMQYKVGGFITNLFSLDGETVEILTKHSVDGPHCALAKLCLDSTIPDPTIRKRLAKEILFHRGLVIVCEAVHEADQLHHPIPESTVVPPCGEHHPQQGNTLTVISIHCRVSCSEMSLPWKVVENICREYQLPVVRTTELTVPEVLHSGDVSCSRRPGASLELCRENLLKWFFSILHSDGSCLDLNNHSSTPPPRGARRTEGTLSHTDSNAHKESASSLGEGCVLRLEVPVDSWLKYSNSKPLVTEESHEPKFISSSFVIPLRFKLKTLRYRALRLLRSVLLGEAALSDTILFCPLVYCFLLWVLSSSKRVDDASPSSVKTDIGVSDFLLLKDVVKTRGIFVLFEDFLASIQVRHLRTAVTEDAIARIWNAFRVPFVNKWLPTQFEQRTFPLQIPEFGNGTTTVGKHLVLLFCGLPGSGKTTICRSILRLASDSTNVLQFPHELRCLLRRRFRHVLVVSRDVVSASVRDRFVVRPTTNNTSGGKEASTSTTERTLDCLTQHQERLLRKQVHHAFVRELQISLAFLENVSEGALLLVDACNASLNARRSWERMFSLFDLRWCYLNCRTCPGDINSDGVSRGTQMNNQRASEQPIVLSSDVEIQTNIRCLVDRALSRTHHLTLQSDPTQVQRVIYEMNRKFNPPSLATRCYGENLLGVDHSGFPQITLHTLDVPLDACVQQLILFLCNDETVDDDALREETHHRTAVIEDSPFSQCLSPCKLWSASEGAAFLRGQAISLGTALVPAHAEHNAAEKQPDNLFEVLLSKEEGSLRHSRRGLRFLQLIPTSCVVRHQPQEEAEGACLMSSPPPVSVIVRSVLQALAEPTTTIVSGHRDWLFGTFVQSKQRRLHQKKQSDQQQLLQLQPLRNGCEGTLKGREGVIQEQRTSEGVWSAALQDRFLGFPCVDGTPPTPFVDTSRLHITVLPLNTHRKTVNSEKDIFIKCRCISPPPSTPTGALPQYLPLSSLNSASEGNCIRIVATAPSVILDPYACCVRISCIEIHMHERPEGGDNKNERSSKGGPTVYEILDTDSESESECWEGEKDNQTMMEQPTNNATNDAPPPYTEESHRSKFHVTLGVHSKVSSSVYCRELIGQLPQMIRHNEFAQQLRVESKSRSASCSKANELSNKRLKMHNFVELEFPSPVSFECAWRIV